jgi:hypothetical protein
LLIHAEIGAPVGAEAVQLDEASTVEKNVQPLSRQQFSLFMLALSSLRSTARFGFLVQLVELVEITGHGHEEIFLECEINSQVCANPRIITKELGVSTEFAVLKAKTP